MFFKTFETIYGDVLVMRQDNDEGNPEVRFYYEPEGAGVCSIALEFDEDSYERRDDVFDEISQEQAEGAAKEISKYF